MFGLTQRTNMKEYVTYEIVISMKCPYCKVPISFNIQPITEYHKIECICCNEIIEITGKLKD